MISKASASECYVYITLPGQTNAVTAGRYELAIDRSGTQTGRFFYGRRYLARPDAVEFDQTVFHTGVLELLEARYTEVFADGPRPLGAPAAD